jgi:hypothetical protein
MLYSEVEARRRIRQQLWMRFLLPLLAVILLVGGLTAAAAGWNSAGFTGLASAATMYLAIAGLISGWVLLVAGVLAFGWIGDASRWLLGWTTRARGFSAILFYRARSLSDGVAHALLRVSEWVAMIEVGSRGLAETGYSMWASWTRKRHG